MAEDQNIDWLFGSFLSSPRLVSVQSRADDSLIHLTSSKMSLQTQKDLSFPDFSEVQSSLCSCRQHQGVMSAPVCFPGEHCRGFTKAHTGFESEQRNRLMEVRQYILSQTQGFSEITSYHVLFWPDTRGVSSLLKQVILLLEHSLWPLTPDPCDPYDPYDPMIYQTSQTKQLS